MTSQEIKNQEILCVRPQEDLACAYMLKEIAYQLAVFNERNDVPKAKHGDMPPCPADPVSAADFSADVLRSCANHIAENKVEPELAAMYLLATANNLVSRPPIEIPEKYRAKLSRKKDT